MAKFAPLGGQTYTLGASIGSTDSSIILQSFLEPVTGTPLTMTLLNTDIEFGTIAPKTSSAEFISFTGITQNSDGTAILTGVTRGLAKKYPFTSDSAYKLPHSGQTQFIVSDLPQLFNKYIDEDNDHTIGGLITFTQPPVGINPGGQPDASDSVIGVTKLTVAPASPTNPLAVGDNDIRVPLVSMAAVTAGELAALPGDNTDVAVGSGNKFVTQTGLQHSAEVYAADTGAADALVITLTPAPTSYTDGMTVRVKVKNANATTTPTIAVNGLTATTIKKNGRNALVASDLVANQLIILIYDSVGSCFQLQTPPALTPPLSPIYANGVTTYDISTSSGTKTIAHGLGRIPTFVELCGMVAVNSAAGLSFSDGSYNGTTNSCVYSYFSDDGGGGALNTASAGSSTSYGISLGSSGGSATGVITVDVTNITITFTKNSSPSGLAYIQWKARA